MVFAHLHFKLLLCLGIEQNRELSVTTAEVFSYGSPRVIAPVIVGLFWCEMSCNRRCN